MSWLESASRSFASLLLLGPAMNASKPTPSAPEELGAIGMSMSGGGYRAAAFHLGTLDYLHHCGLEPALRQISTVSGGTFVGASYMRLTSLLALTSSVFMARIRGLVSRGVYTDPSHEHKRVSNAIEDLNLADDEELELELGPELRAPSPALARVGRCAASVPTTLWFDSDYEQPALVASGQASTCLNLMRWIRRVHGVDVSAYSPAALDRPASTGASDHALARARG